MGEIHKNFSILIVEDEEISLKYLIRLLEKEGFSVEGVQTGNEALERIKKGPMISFYLIYVYQI